MEGAESELQTPLRSLNLQTTLRFEGRINSVVGKVFLRHSQGINYSTIQGHIQYRR